MKRKQSLLSLAAGIALLLLSLPAQAITIGFSPVMQDVFLGETFDVELVISGLGEYAADSLGAFDLDVNFHPEILAFNSATFGDPVLGDQLDLWELGSGVTLI